MIIRNRLRATLLVLFAFIVGLVALNFYTFEKLEGDAPAINASGSLRMRAYQLAWLSARLVPAEGETAADIRRSMRTRIGEYDRILAGLSQGSAEMRVTAASDTAVKEQLQTVESLWETYRTHVFDVLGADTPEGKAEANAIVAAEVVGYVSEVDRLVMAYDHASQDKIAVSHKVGAAAVVLAFIIFVVSSYCIITEVLRPLAALTASFRDVAGKEGDLTQQLTAQRYDEIGRIVHSFNSFVSDLRHIMQRAKACSTEVSGLSDTLWQASIENSKAVEYNAVTISNVAARVNEQDENIKTLTASVAGIAAHISEMQAGAHDDLVNLGALNTSVEMVRACAQVAASAAEEVTKASKEIADLTEDSAAAIEQETASLEAFAATAEHLKGLAAELDALVGRFKV